MKQVFCVLLASCCVLMTSAQPNSQEKNSIAPVGVIKGLSDEALMETVQRQTFRFFWHYAHPVSGLARERSNTVKARYYWDYINEAWDEPNLSTTTFGEEACAIGGTGFGILSTIVAVERGWIGRDTAVKRLIKIADFLIRADAYHGIYPHFMDGKILSGTKQALKQIACLYQICTVVFSAERNGFSSCTIQPMWEYTVIRICFQ